MLSFPVDGPPAHPIQFDSPFWQNGIVINDKESSLNQRGGKQQSILNMCGVQLPHAVDCGVPDTFLKKSPTQHKEAEKSVFSEGSMWTGEVKVDFYQLLLHYNL